MKDHAWQPCHPEAPWPQACVQQLPNWGRVGCDTSLKQGKSGRKNSQSTLLLCEDNIGGTSGAKCWHRNQAVSNHRKHQSNNYTKQPEITTRTRLSVNSIGQAKKKKKSENSINQHILHIGLYSKSWNKTEAFMPQAHRHHQLLWSSPLLFYWRTLLSQLQAAWAACPCPGLCSNPRKIKEKQRKRQQHLVFAINFQALPFCLLAHTNKNQDYDHHCDLIPHPSLNIRRVKVAKIYPAWVSTVAFVQRSRNYEVITLLQQFRTFEAVIFPKPHTENAAESCKGVANHFPLFQRTAACTATANYYPITSGLCSLHHLSAGTPSFHSWPLH